MTNKPHLEARIEEIKAKPKPNMCGACEGRGSYFMTTRCMICNGSGVYPLPKTGALHVPHPDSDPVKLKEKLERGGV